mmetsp:Transcript_13711/g.33539  ORF Transcript_13711/g.33539 Transcript_13711/m.33539 type:complete len:80 (-) Transcript_13711:49-288(-)
MNRFSKPDTKIATWDDDDFFKDANEEEDAEDTDEVDGSEEDPEAEAEDIDTGDIFPDVDVDGIDEDNEDGDGKPDEDAV